MRRLKRQNLTSNNSLLSDSGPIVTLTSFGERLKVVFYTIESIANGSQLPSRLTLWVEKEWLDKGLPDSLQRLQKRGLEIKETENLGPHKKYFPEIMSERGLDQVFVTADDDTLYPKYWLDRLWKSHKANPDVIHCFRAHRIQFDTNGKLKSYAEWGKCLSRKPSHLHFSTGSCGVLFPAKMRTELRNLGDAFKTQCPYADDIWLNATALNAGIPVSQVVEVPKRFYEIPGTRQAALATFNNGKGGNDQQLKKTYGEEALARLRQSK